MEITSILAQKLFRTFHECANDTDENFWIASVLIYLLFISISNFYIKTVYIYKYIYIYIYVYIYIYYSPLKLAWVRIEPTNTEFYSDVVQLALRANFVQLFQFHCLFSVRFHFWYYLCQLPCLLQLKFSWVNHMSVAEWTDACGIHHWRIIWSSYRKLTWVGFEPTIMNFVQLL